MPADPHDRLAADAARPSPVPAVTYRLQMHAGFNLAAARGVVEYLAALGVTHAYTSSLLTAKPGSTHGYDVTDHGTLNPEIGTEDELRAWVAELRARGMGLVVDTVPNHMSVGAGNAWWQDILENGPSSPFAGYFDIAWQDHPREQLRGRVLLPILGVRYGEAVDGGQFVLKFENGAFAFDLNGTRLPIDPRTYDQILGPAADAAKAAGDIDDPGVQKLVSVLNAVRHLPWRNDPDPARVADGRAEIAVIKRRLATLAPEIAARVAAEVARVNATPADIDALIDAQAYRPCDWRVASDEINYRRFFDVNDLAGLAAERDDVFRATHAKLFAWVAGGLVDGLRIDHPDGLFDPKQYLARLQAAYCMSRAESLLAGSQADYPSVVWDDIRDALYPGPVWTAARDALAARFADSPDRPLWVVVEKILGTNERTPADWATAGTTGYEFAAVLNGLFVDPAAEPAATAAYRAFTGETDPYPEVVYQKKFLVLQSSLTSELYVLAGLLDRLAQAQRWSRDFTLNGLRHALREVVASFPVYRTYIDGRVTDTDRALVRLAVRRAVRRNPLLGRDVFQFIRDTLLLKDPPTGPAAPEYRAEQVRFAGKFQQLTAPVMAKGAEDTAFYTYTRLASLNEVGGDPGRFGRSPADVHAFLADRSSTSPAGLSPLSTHDTKRSEDVRARINVLAEFPAEWADRATRWADLNRPHKTDLDGDAAPDANEEFLLYQTLVGTWPATAEPGPDYVDRVVAYMTKATREAKVHTSWIDPVPEYEAAVAGFVRAILDPAAGGAFRADLTAFVRDRVHLPGCANSLAQCVIRATAPGVPDVYQGTELWDDSLVDPDNRRPVDYARRRELLADLDSRATRDPLRLARELAARPADDRLKLFVVSRTLRLRRDRAAVFAGSYHPATVTGPRAEHVFAYTRSGGGETVVVAVPRQTVALTGGRSFPVGADVWADTVLRIPGESADRTWVNVFTGERLSATGGRLACGDVFANFPVAVFVEA